MSYNSIILTKKDFVGTITLNHPPANAVNLGIREDLNSAVIELEQSRDVRVVISPARVTRASVPGWT
jgi:enoyl-CoA hydratase/carnithine racemase